MFKRIWSSVLFKPLGSSDTNAWCAKMGNVELNFLNQVFVDYGAQGFTRLVTCRFVEETSPEENLDLSSSS